MAESEYYTVTVSADALGWTNHWLGRRRCDLLTVAIGKRADLAPRIRITAVESKSRIGAEPLKFDPTKPPFDEAIEQVVMTLDALAAFLRAESGNSVLADLKLSSLFEHLASEVLAQLAPIHSTETYKLSLLDTLSALSKRDLRLNTDLLLDGLVVVTQRDSNVKTTEYRIQRAGAESDWAIRVILCGIPALREMLEEAGLSVLAEQSQLTGPIIGPMEDSEATRPAEMFPNHAFERELAEVAESSPPAEVAPTRGGMANSASLSPATLDMISALETACRLRRFPIDPIETRLATEGPTLITVPVALQAGEKIAPIQQATSDLARELGVSAVVVENDPNRSYYVRFLLPRADREFPPIPSTPPPESDEHYLPVWLGAQVDGEPYRCHVSEWPHLLVAGTTGSGKTTFLRSLLLQIDRLPPDARVVIVDGKGEYDYVDVIAKSRFVDNYNDVLLGNEHVVPVLEWLVNEEVVRRREMLREYFKDNPRAPRAARQAYKAAQGRKEAFPASPLVVFVDEFAEIMLAAGSLAREFEDLIQRVVQAGRSALVHLVLATQRPDANVLRGAVKANLPSRVALALPSHHDSMTVLNTNGAEDLLGKGDLIYQSSTVDRVRLQGYASPV